jgi:hypothetical protein
MIHRFFRQTMKSFLKSLQKWWWNNTFPISNGNKTLGKTWTQTESTDMLSTGGETSLGIRVVLLELDKVLLFSCLYIYLYLRCKFFCCPDNQIKIIFYKRTKSHFIPQLVTCALGDLTMCYLAYTPCLMTASISMKIPFLSLSRSWVEGLLVFGCHTFVCW